MDCCEVPWQPVALFSDAVAEGGGGHTESSSTTHTFSFRLHTPPRRTNTRSSYMQNHAVRWRLKKKLLLGSVKDVFFKHWKELAKKGVPLQVLTAAVRNCDLSSSGSTLWWSQERIKWVLMIRGRWRGCEKQSFGCNWLYHERGTVTSSESSRH